MARWFALLLLLIVIAAGIDTEPLEIEQRLHGKVVQALADEDLSEVRVQLDGRNVLLSGPEGLLPSAQSLVSSVSGIQQVETFVVATKVIGKEHIQPKQDHQDQGLFTQVNTDLTPYLQVIHPEATAWPLKKVPQAVSELSVTKIKQSVEVSGKVPNNQIKHGIHTIIGHLVDVPENLFDVTVNQLNDTPDWYLQDLPLFIPFIQWVEEGKLEYQGNRISLEGMVLNKHSWKAIETAIRNIPSQYQIENRLQMGTD